MDKEKWQKIKEKLPSLNEVGSMAGKLFKDIKKSVCEIVEDYKAKHPTETKTEHTPEDKKSDDKE